MQRQKNSPTFYKLNDNGIRAMNFETARIHFLRDSFSPPSLSSLLKLPKDTTYQFTLSLQTTFAVNLLLNKEGK